MVCLYSRFLYSLSVPHTVSRVQLIHKQNNGVKQDTVTGKYAYYTHMCIAYMHPYMHTVNTYIHTANTYIQTCIHTPMHTSIHTYLRT